MPLHYKDNFDEIDQLLLIRKLDEAKSATRKVLQSANNENYLAGLARSYVYLGKISTLKGEYSGDYSHVNEAVSHYTKVLNLGLRENKQINIDTNIGLSDAYRILVDRETSKFYAERALEEAQTHNLEKKEVYALCCLSRLHNLKNESDEALKLAREMLKISTRLKDKMLIKDSYSRLGSALTWNYAYEESKECFDEVLKYSLTLGDKEGEVIAYNNLGIYYGYINDFKNAIGYLRMSLQKSKSICFDKHHVYCHTNIANVHRRLYNFEAAQKHYQKIINEYPNFLQGRTYVIFLYNTAATHFQLQEYEQAIDYFNRCFIEAKAINLRPQMALSKSKISEAYIELNNMENAMDYADQSSTYFVGINNRLSRINKINFARIFYLKGDYEKAINYTNQAYKLAKLPREDKQVQASCYFIFYNIYKNNGDYKKALDFHELYNKEYTNQALIQKDRQVLAKILKSNHDLEMVQDLLLEKNNRIEDQNKSLLHANEDLQQFTYAVSHDLKEPLRNISNFSQMISRKYQGLVNDDFEEMFGFIENGSKRMMVMLKDMYKFATVGRDAIELEMLSMNKIVSAIEDDLYFKIEETKAQIKYQNLPVLYMNKSLMIHLFQNLINNAIKFKKEGEIPVIGITAKKKGGFYQFRVRDNGKGIPENMLSRVFKIFVQVERNHALSDSGSGVGLSICKKIINSMKGEIWVESQINQGTSFFFTIPIIDPDSRVK